jgi:hypothetical protein
MEELKHIRVYVSRPLIMIISSSDAPWMAIIRFNIIANKTPQNM